MFNFKNLQISPVLRHIIIGLLIILVMFFILLFSNYGLLKRYKLQNEKDDLKSEIENLNYIHDSLLIKIEESKTDTFEIERIAREKYGLVKPNEKIFFINLDSSNIK